jgi:hypothetical protein
MSTLALHAEIYTEDGIRAAVGAFADFGSFQWDERPEGGYYTVSFDAADDVDPVELEGEFGNFALARSIESANAAPV